MPINGNSIAANMMIMKVVKSRLIPLLALACCSGAYADAWHVDPINGCMIYDDEDLADREVVVSWSGACDADMKASGQGILSWFENGELAGRFVGAVKNGKANGHGVVFVLQDDGYDRYEGEFTDNEVDGSLVATGADGSSFEGTMDTRSLSGFGRFADATGGSYSGEFAGGLMHGEGHRILDSGEQYLGSFLNNEPDGEGEWLSAEGDYYKGGFSNGEFSGSGRFDAINGDVYEGQFRNDMPNGHGIFTSAAGEIIEGNFKDGWPDGDVNVASPDGTVSTQRWANGEQVE